MRKVFSEGIIRWRQAKARIESNNLEYGLKNRILNLYEKKLWDGWIVFCLDEKAPIGAKKYGEKDEGAKDAS